MTKKYRYCGLVILMFLLPAVVAGFFPQIDLAVSGWFYTPGRGFVTSPFLEAVHHAGPYAVVAAALAVALVLLRRKILTVRDVAFIALCFLLGPGLLVNGVLKEHYGRARPMQVGQFGGSAHFTSALTPAHECRHNCSFVAGDPSVGFTLIAFALLFPRGRAALTAVALSAGAGLGLMRIAQGGHFLSDVLFSAVVCITAALALFSLFYRDGAKNASS
jgi:lipid A 4'-phosphatase